MSLKRWRRSGLLGLIAGVVLTWAYPAIAREPFAVLRPSDLGYGRGGFGSAVAISGDWLAVGAFLDGDLGNAAGAVYMFKNEGGTWVERAKLTASDGGAFDFFGGAVALEGETLVVGAPADDFDYPHDGAAYMFRFTGTTWVEEAKLISDRLIYQDDFGISVDVSGSTVAVGASVEHGGAIYFFQYDGSDWVRNWKVEGMYIPFALGLGASIALSGDHLVAGDPYDHEGGQGAGAAYVFRRAGSNWVQEAKLLAPFGAQGDRFGKSVAFTGGPIVVGADGVDDPGPTSGAAYVFVPNAGSWVLGATLTGSDIAAGDQFGRACAIHGNLALIGAPGDENPQSHDGTAYLFRSFAYDWPQIDKLLPIAPALPIRAGTSVALNGEVAVVGTRGRTVYLFDLPDPPDGVPAVSQWGLAIVALGLLIAGRFVWRRQRTTPRAAPTPGGGSHPGFLVAVCLFGSAGALAQDPELPFHPERVLVKFQPGTAEMTRDSVHASAGGTRVRVFDLVEGLELARVSAETLSQAYRIYKADPNVAIVECDYGIEFFAGLRDWGLRG